MEDQKKGSMCGLWNFTIDLLSKEPQWIIKGFFSHPPSESAFSKQFHSRTSWMSFPSMDKVFHIIVAYYLIIEKVNCTKIKKTKKKFRNDEKGSKRWRENLVGNFRILLFSIFLLKMTWEMRELIIYSNWNF
jgi:hypothetical protein